MSYYLIGIGGTGARCMEAFVNLCGAGLLKDSQPIQIVNVDADVSCGNLTKTQHTVELYRKAKAIGFGNSGMFKNDIEPTRMWNPVAEKCKTMDDIFQRKMLINKKDTKPLGFLYDSLFTEQERTTDLDMGFRGHPAIGSAVMNQQMDANDEPWKDLLPKINSDKDARIFLFASVFGGTGAAGFPTIAKLLHKFLHKDGDGNCIAKIGGALVLPYFEFPAASDDVSNEMQAKVDEFMLNTRSALDYYDESHILGSVFTSIYMVGDNDLTPVKKFSLGSGEQKNEANYIEMYAALAAFDFFNKSKFEGTTVPMIAREDTDSGTITWEDLPDSGTGPKLKEQLGTFMKVLYVYKYGVLPALERCGQDEKAQYQVAWYMDLVKKAGGIDVYHSQEEREKFEALGEYATEFFQWMKDIISNPKRQIKLINSRACDAGELVNNLFTLDAYQVVLPTTNRKDKLTGKEFWQRLCNYTKKMDKVNASGAEILMEAIYTICKE